MKKLLYILAALAAAGLWFAGCKEPDSANPYNIDAKLSCFVNAMGGVEFAGGQPDKGEKFKPIMKGANVTVDESGNATLTAEFRKSFAKVMGKEVNTFIDPRNSTPGYYDADGVKQTAIYTMSPEGDTATPPEDDPDHAAGVRYVTSMTFPVSKNQSVYYLWFYLNSSEMGVQFCDGKGTASAGVPDAHSKFEAKLTIDWSTYKPE